MNFKNVNKNFISLFIIGFIFIHAIGQVGIGTLTPNGILDVESSTQGVVLPVVALEDRYQESPVANPDGSGSLAIGTVVYNTNATSNGTVVGVSDDVALGIYVWDGTQWLSQFSKKQYVLYEQSVQNMRTRSNTPRSINGVNGQTFTPEFTGTYRIEVNVNFGGGITKNPTTTGPPADRSNGEMNIARMTGDFTITFNGTTKTITVGSYSLAYEKNNSGGASSPGNGIYFGIWKQYTVVFYEVLTAGVPTPISLTFTQDTAFAFDGEGDNGNSDGMGAAGFDGGDGHVGFDTPCTVEVSFIGE